MTMGRATFSVIVGALIRRSVRIYMDKLQFREPSVSIKEHKGVLESEFIIQIEKPNDEIKEFAYKVLEMMKKDIG